ncbi:MAG: hypothetical protein B5M52_06340 [Helicobacteraceae bacterium 4484_230]|nr:MAG: hypothetical protein B5M52_06340 [Helicobacteraceae bacterium 4484_230]
MKKFFISGLFLVAAVLFAAITFPELTGRVVDNADLLSPEQEQKVSLQLEALESNTTDQLVVVTLKSLDGYDIADYGYQLGRHWGIGQENKDNGALLIVAPNERKVRIEVGYGLEGVLTDAKSSWIIQNIILPAFKSGEYDAGIQAGAEAIVGILMDPSEMDEAVQADPENIESLFGILFPIVAFFSIFISILPTYKKPFVSTAISIFFGFVTYSISHSVPISLFISVVVGIVAYFGKTDTGRSVTGSSSTGGYSGSSFSSGGFSSGGGSFGGGGASGSW